MAARMRSVITAAVGVTIAVVFFPLWFAIPVAAVLAVWGLGMAVLGASVVVDKDAGLLTMRMGLIVRRTALTDVTAVLVEEAKVSVARAGRGEISLYTWRKSPLDALLGLPAAADDIGHAISRAVALAKADGDAPAPAPAGVRGAGERAPRTGRTPARTRSRLATALLGGAGIVAIAGALLVRVHWGSPVLTVLGVLIAVVLGISGLVYLLVALWILLTGRAPRVLPTL